MSQISQTCTAFRRSLPKPHTQTSHHRHTLNRTFFVDATTTIWVRDRGLDHAVEREKNFRPLINIKNFIKSKPSKSLPISIHRPKSRIPHDTHPFHRIHPQIPFDFRGFSKKKAMTKYSKRSACQIKVLKKKKNKKVIHAKGDDEEEEDDETEDQQEGELCDSSDDEVECDDVDNDSDEEDEDQSETSVEQNAINNRGQRARKSNFDGKAPFRNAERELRAQLRKCVDIKQYKWKGHLECFNCDGLAEQIG